MADTIRHVAIIMDGNRRWAKQRNRPPISGHRAGAKALEKVSLHALNLGLEFLSVYIFSSENWSRASNEVHDLHNLFVELFKRKVDLVVKNGGKIVFLGDITDTRLPAKLKKAIQQTEEKTKNNKKGTLGVCLNYGGQQEIATAASKVATSGKTEITTEDIAANLYHPEVPPIDLLIRTSGEKRLSNFMLWRSAYSELVFVDKHWPDFTPEDLDVAIEEYNRRNRRFGGN